MSLYDTCLTTCWAITPDALTTILTVVSRDGTAAMLAEARAIREARIQAVEAMDGTPIDGTRAAIKRDGVAILSVIGPIVRYADTFADVSGLTSIETLAKDFRAVLDDPSVKAVLFEVASPGGEIAGIQEFADTVYRARGPRPIVAYVSDLGASAAYWIASAADEVVIAPTALVGSIGVIAAVRDPSKTSARDIEFVSSQSPKKRADPTTESGRTQIQAIVDDLGGIFVNAVATHRGVSVETVLRDYGQGGVLVGAAAVTAGLADRLGSFEGVIAELAGKTERPLVWVPGGGKHVPASKVPAALAGGSYMATLQDRFWEFMGKTKVDDEAEQHGNALATGISNGTTLAITPAGATTSGFLAAAPLRTSEQDDELARIRAELAKERSARAHDNAVAFAESEITSLRAMPAEREALIEAYMQAATDDLTFGASTAVAGASRVEALKQRQAARPAHTLTSEAVPVNDAARAALVNTTTTATADKPATPEERKHLLAMTPLGQQAAKANGV